MLSGEDEAIVTSAATLVTSRLAGADVTMIMSTTPTFPSVLMAVKSITDVNQLRGKAGGVNRFGSNTDFVLRLVLRKNAIDPDKDVRLIQVGGTAQMVAAISRGLIQFALFNEPFVRQAEKLGFKTSSMCHPRRSPSTGTASRPRSRRSKLDGRYFPGSPWR